jgi:hypothetical protein
LGPLHDDAVAGHFFEDRSLDVVGCRHSILVRCVFDSGPKGILSAKSRSCVKDSEETR